MRRSVRSLAVAAGAAVAAVAGPASATWSILIVDTRTGEVAVASATCLIRLDLRELTPVLVSGVGAVTAQSAGDSSGRNRALIRDRLIQGVPLDAILAELAATDGNHQTRQYGMIDVTGDALTFTGTQASDWAGGQVGQSGDLAWAVQGNILTGPNVVQDAVDAIVNTDGDLAAKLMASMVAAREAGGDGRCSCAPQNPTGCGSPPPGDFKSAHIGYMLIARLEDLDASRAIYFTPNHAAHFATPDLDQDGRPDFVASQFGDGELTLFANDTEPGYRLSTAIPGATIETGAGQIVGMNHADVDGDGIDDVVFIATGPNEVGYLPGDGQGGFGAAVRTPLAGSPTKMAIGRIDNAGGVEIAVSMEVAGRVAVLSGGALAVVAELDGLAGPTGVAIAPMDADAEGDLVVATRGDDTVTVYRGTGSFGLESWRTWTDAGLGPVDLAAGAIGGSGLNDIVVIGGASQRMAVLTQEPEGVFTASFSTLVNTGRQVELGDFLPGGGRGIVTMALGNRTIEMHRERDGEPGVFESYHLIRAAPAQESVHVADINLDGLDDIVSGGFSRGLTLLDNIGDGTFPEYNGFANGDYFMELNVADTVNSSPDPVDQLLVQFADWRAGLEGRVDAVRTTVAAPSRVEAGQTWTLRVRARDWRGDTVDPAVLGAEAFVVSGQASIADVRTPEPGVAEIDVVASATPGVDLIGVRLDDGQGRPVRLMPDARVEVLADLADFNADGQRNIFDLADFLGAFNAQDPAADLTGDQIYDAADLTAFVDRFLN